MKQKLTHPSDLLFVSPMPHKKLRLSTSSSAPNNDNNLSYSRKNKSLGLLASTIASRYSARPMGGVIHVDLLATELQVERRRIYEVLNILGSVQMVIKHDKDTYVWNSGAELPQVLALLQREGRRAQQFGQTSSSETQANKSLFQLSQQFLQVYLLSNKEYISLPEVK
jgi:hypothetical protein